MPDYSAEEVHYQRIQAARSRMSIRFRNDDSNENNDATTQQQPESIWNRILNAWGQRIFSNLSLQSDVTNQQQQPQQQSTNQTSKLVWSQHLSVLLAGTRDSQSPLHLFRGYENIIIREIYTMVYQGWIDAVLRTPPAHLIGRLPAFSESIGEDQDYATGFQFGAAKSMVRTVLWLDEGYRSLGQSRHDHPQIAFSVCRTGIQFPTPQDINVNMMPFIMGDKSSLPLYLHQYYDMIMKCPVEDSMMGQVCYVTIMECYVEKNSTQRRSGLHVEAIYDFTTEASCKVSLEHHWGQGVAFGPDELIGGLYMVSNMDHTTSVWNALITDISEVNQHGSIEHLRPYIGTPFRVKAGDMIWLTDRTPHEALPRPESGYRQYFRLVTSNISVWFEEHSTPNPNVPLPPTVTIIKGSKFK